MKISELTEVLSCADEEEVYIDIDGTLYDISFGQVEEAFDGFDTVYPAAITLIPIDQK